MAGLSINFGNFAVTLSGRPWDVVIKHAARKAVTEKEAFCPSEDRTNAGNGINEMTEEAPLGFYQFADGSEAPSETFQEGYTKTRAFKQWGVKVGVTQKTLEDAKARDPERGQILSISKITNALKRGAVETDERRAANALLNAHDSTYAYEDICTADADALYSTSHTFKNSRTLSQSNRAGTSTAPSQSTINTARRTLFALKDAQGCLTPYFNVKLLCAPYTTETYNLAQFFTSKGDVTNAANRDANPIAVLDWAGIQLKEIRHFGTNTQWYLVSGEADLSPLVMWIRHPYDVSSDVNTLAGNTRWMQLWKWDTIAARDWLPTYAAI